MSGLIFKHLNKDWNAQPNAPNEQVTLNGTSLLLTFYLNPWAYEAMEREVGCLTFAHCSKWRLGGTNDEGWYRGQCRYGKAAPAWGQFYEVFGAEDQRSTGVDWSELTPTSPEKRHFLFYLRDETFECFAEDWHFTRFAPRQLERLQ